MDKRERIHQGKPAGTRMSLVVLALAACLLPVSIGLAVIQHRDSRESTEHSLRREADRQADLLSSYFERARSIVLLLAHNPAFRSFYDQPGSIEEKIHEQGPHIESANEALAYLETLYPKAIGEACLIDRTGQEIARVVRGDVAGPKDLSPDESLNAFFEVVMSMTPGEVHQTDPYVSPDTGEWVIANATKIPETGGNSPGFVHFEVTIESFRVEAAGSSAPVQVVDRGTGAIIIDSEKPQEVGAPLGPNHANHSHGAREPIPAHPDARFAGRLGPGEDGGTAEIEGHLVAFRRVAGLPGNANDWVVVARSPQPFGQFEGVGASSVAFIAFAAFLLGLAALNVLISQRNLTRAATTDGLTGLSNRRLLMSDLAAAAGRTEPNVLVLFDLDGFKDYNDAFGHPAGDSLLARLAGRLGDAVGKRGRAYRMGGDEFCVLAPVRDHEERELVLWRSTAALTEDGQGFSVGCSAGWVSVPEETTDPEEALRLADQRMYVQKGLGRSSAGNQTRDVLLSVLSERNSSLGEHIAGVADLAERVGSVMGLEDEELRHVCRAAELHDIGKVAIPDSILLKPGPLDGSEWQYMRRHTVIGERILSSAPSLEPVAKLVRWSHERFDGAGYPDELAGDEIPLGARIVAVCDAYDAMVGDRPYRRSLTSEQAMDELKRCAGTQFDPLVVEAFIGVVTAATAPV